MLEYGARRRPSINLVKGQNKRSGAFLLAGDRAAAKFGERFMLFEKTITVPSVGVY